MHVNSYKHAVKLDILEKKKNAKVYAGLCTQVSTLVKNLLCLSMNLS